jgi:hypothetical protein
VLCAVAECVRNLAAQFRENSCSVPIGFRPAVVYAVKGNLERSQLRTDSIGCVGDVTVCERSQLCIFFVCIRIIY